MRAQALDGSATDVLETVRRLGFLQIDVVAPVERPQHLVLFSRLGPGVRPRRARPAALGGTRALRMGRVHLPDRGPAARPRADPQLPPLAEERRASAGLREFLTENRAFKRYVLREIERNGPLLSRDLEDRSKGEREKHRWWGASKVGLMLLCLHIYGEITVVGRQGGERLWDLTSRWWPETETVSIRDADAIREERRFRTQGVQLVKGEWHAHPDAERRRRPGPCRPPLPLRPPGLRPRPRRGAVGLPLPARDVRSEGEARVRLLRAAAPGRRPGGRPRGAALRPEDRRARAARSLGRHVAPRRGPRRPRAWLGATG